MKDIIRVLWQAIVLFAIAIVIGFAVNAMSDDPLPLIAEPKVFDEEKYPVVDAETVKNHIENGTAIIIDARDPNEYEEGHIQGALNLPASSFNDYFREIGEGLPRDFPIVVYCQGGLCDQSHIVLYQLEQIGFMDLHIYQEGWLDWVEHNFPTE